MSPPQKTTTVRLRDPIPSHCKPPGIDEAGRIAAAGRTIRILLPPVEPYPGLTCGAERVWQVHPDDARAMGNPNGYLAVCEHQAEID